MYSLVNNKLSKWISFLLIFCMVIATLGIFAPSSFAGTDDEIILLEEGENTLYGGETITAGGEYTVDKTAAGVISISTTEKVTLVGGYELDADLNETADSYSISGLSFDCSSLTTGGANVELKNLAVTAPASLKNLFNFAGIDNTLTITGTNLLDVDTNATGYAAVHVAQNDSLLVNGSGTLYFYKREQGAGFGGNTGQLNGDLTFGDSDSSDLHIFAKGTKQGALIGAGSGSGSATGAPGKVVFDYGTYNLITNSRGAAVGGAAGSGGASAGTSVYVNHASLNINVDYSGAAVGGGGYDVGNDASGGNIYIAGGSLRTYVDTNAANNVTGYGGVILTEGVNDAPITAARWNNDNAETQERVYICPVNTDEFEADAPSYTVNIDGAEEPSYTGGLHGYHFINETFDKETGSQIAVNKTTENWVPNDDPNLYLYLTGKDHTVTINGVTKAYVWDSEAKTFTMQEIEIEDPAAPEKDENGVYQITNAQQLMWFAAYVNTTDSAIDGKLMNDIDVSGEAYKSIGNKTIPFAGNFDGGGYTVTLNITAGTYTGIFGMTSGAAISNIAAAGTVSSSKFSSGIVGYAVNTTVDGCINRTNVTTTSNQSGGIIGYADGVQVTNCGNEGNISALGSYVGGIIGISNSTEDVISKCYNKGSVTAKYYVGGIVGDTFAQSVTDCYNTGAVNSFSEDGSVSGGTSGIAGCARGIMEVTNCYNTGAITAAAIKTPTAAMIGYAASGANIELTNDYYLTGSTDKAYTKHKNATVTATDVEEKSEEDMKTLAATLGESFKEDSSNINQGYPVLATEAGEITEPEKTVWAGALDFSWYDENDVQTSYHISTPEQWAALAWICSEDLAQLSDYATNTNGNITGITGTVPTAQNPFAGVQFYLDNDIDMGGVYDSESGTWSGPNYYPVGSQGANDTSTGIFYGLFYGSFDGQGHVVKNIYCNREGEGGSAGKSGSQSVGLFGRVGSSDGQPTPDVNIVIKNVAVTGRIIGYRSVGGIVGKTLHVSSGYTIKIENCMNFATINTKDGAKGTGGIVGALWNRAEVNNCANFGNITGDYRTSNVAGISGAAEGPTSNSYNVGTIINPAKAANSASVALNQSTANVTNCYGLEGSAPGYTSSIVNGNTLVSGGWKTAAEMKGSSFATLLNAEYENWIIPESTDSIAEYMDSLGLSGYPVPYIFVTHVEKVMLNNIAVTAEPKLSYTEGEMFETSGMAITANYSDGSTKPVTEYTVSSEVSLENPLSAANKTVTVSGEFEGKAFTFTYDLTVASLFTAKAVASANVVPKGTEFTVSLVLSSAESRNITSFMGDLYYDSAKVEVVENGISTNIETASDPFGLGGDPVITNDNGSRIRVLSIFCDEPVTGDKTVMTVTFKALDDMVIGSEDAAFSLQNVQPTVADGEGEDIEYNASIEAPVSVKLTNYPVTLPAGATSVAGINADGQYLYGTDITFEMTDATGKILYMKAGEGEETEMTAVGGVYTIPAASVTDQITVRAGDPPLGTIELIEFNGAPADYKLAVFVPTNTGAAVKYLYDGNEMFKSDKDAYKNGYLYFVPKETEAAEALSNVTTTEGTNKAMLYSGDVNGNSLIKIDDAQIVYDLYNSLPSFLTDVLFEKLPMFNRLEADVNGDGTIDALDARLIITTMLNAA